MIVDLFSERIVLIECFIYIMYIVEKDSEYNMKWKDV